MSFLNSLVHFLRAWSIFKKSRSEFLLKLINITLSKLPLRLKGFCVDYSYRYFLISPELLRNERNIITGYVSGMRVLDWLSVHTNLDEKSRILDVGCGDGRVASAFARQGTKFRGKYYGFDIDKKRIDSLNQLFKSNVAFNFTHADIYHSYYNRNGMVDADSYDYEYSPNSLDIIFFNSIFSHLRLNVISSNLSESFRCLSSEGQIWATCYVIDENVDLQGELLVRKFDTHYDDGYTATPDNPEGCVGFNKDKLISAFLDAGFRVDRYIPGFWKGKRQSLDQHEQDIFILSKSKKHLTADL